MNCKDYMKAIAAEPSQTFDGAGHASACESCATFRDEILALDKKIAKAMKLSEPSFALPAFPPVGEPGGKVTRLPLERDRRATFAWLGLAASVLLATVLGFRFMSDDAALPDIIYATLADEIIAHLDHEPISLQVTNKKVSERLLDRVVAGHVTEMDVGLVTYANSCVINGHAIPHLVIQGKRGPVTLLLLPDEMIDSTVTLQGAAVTGVILPVGKGSIAIIGERDEPLEKLQQQLVDSVKWSI